MCIMSGHLFTLVSASQRKEGLNLPAWEDKSDCLMYQFAITAFTFEWSNSWAKEQKPRPLWAQFSQLACFSWQCKSHLNFKTCTKSHLFSQASPKLAQPAAQISDSMEQINFVLVCYLLGLTRPQMNLLCLVWSPPLYGFDPSIPDPNIPVTHLSKSWPVDHCSPIPFNLPVLLSFVFVSHHLLGSLCLPSMKN